MKLSILKILLEKIFQQDLQISLLLEIKDQKFLLKNIIIYYQLLKKEISKEEIDLKKKKKVNKYFHKYFWI